MFYFGLRSSPEYLASLDALREEAAPAALVSVIGGFAFLHALHPAVRSLTLIDTDPEAQPHWHLVGRLILSARSLLDLACLLSGGHAPRALQAGAPVAWAPRIDLRERLARVLPPPLLALYGQTYGAMTIDAASGEGRIGQARVLFTGEDLTPMSFSWRFGQGNLRSDASLATMQDVLRRIPVAIGCGALQDFDLRTLPPTGATPTVLASNCESPMFTLHDVVFARAARHDQPVRYLSWLRDGWARPRSPSTPAPPVQFDARRFAEDAHVLHLGAAEVPPPLRELVERARPFDPAPPPPLQRAYGLALLVMIGGTAPVALRHLAELAPTFRRILWLRPPGEACMDEAVSQRYDAAPIGDGPAVLYELRALRGGWLTH